MNTANPDNIFTTEQYSGVSYIDDYELFMKKLAGQGGNMAAGEVGEMITRMAAHFIRYNLMQARTLKMFHKVLHDTISMKEDGGKAMAVGRAESIANASPEAAAYQEARVHVANIEQCINALKALQRGILNEYSHSGT